MYPRPLKDRVLVKQNAKKDKLASGLYVPETSERALYTDVGTVLAVGSTVSADDVKVGDRVMFSRTPGSALMPDKREASLYGDDWTDLLMLGVDSIIGVITEE